MTAIRLAVPGDEARLNAFLTRHVNSSMFLLGNLESHGLGGGPHPDATRYALAEAEGRITGVLGATRGGYLMCQLPGPALALAPDLLAALAPVVMQGITGDAEQVDSVLAHLSLPPAAFALNRVEPLMQLPLDTLFLPDPPPLLRRPTEEDRALLLDWFTGYVIDTGHCSPERAAIRATEATGRAITKGETRLLVAPSGRALAMAALNARAGAAVQVGGVYVPPEQRGKRLAGAAVGALLAEARANGATRAILFAAADPARRAYARLGFAEIGAYRLALLDTPQPVALRPCPA